MEHDQPLMVRIAAVSSLCGLARPNANRVIQVMVHAGMIEVLLEGLSNVHKLDADLRAREELNKKLRTQMGESNNSSYAQRLGEMEASMEHEYEQRMILQELMVGCLMRLTTYVDESSSSLDRSLLKVLLVLFQGQTQARLLSLATICVFHLGQQPENAAMLIELGAIKVVVRWIAASKPLVFVRQANASKKGRKGKMSKLPKKRSDRDALLMHGGEDDRQSVGISDSTGPMQREKLHVYLLGALWLLLGQARPGSDAHHRLSRAGGLHVMLDVLAHGEPVAQELAVQVLWTSTNRSLANRSVVILEGVIQLLLMVIGGQRMDHDGNLVGLEATAGKPARRWQLPLIACQYMHCLMQDEDAWQHRFAGPKLAEADKASVVEAAMLDLFVQDEPEICEYAGTALATVTLDDYKKEVVVKLKGVNVLVGALVRYHTTATAAEGKFYKSAVKAAHVLMNISCCAKWRKLVAQQAMKVVLSLSRRPKRSELQQYARRILENLLEHPQNRTRLYKEELAFTGQLLSATMANAEMMGSTPASRSAQSNQNSIRYFNNEDGKLVTMDGATLEHFDSATAGKKKGNSLGKSVGIGSVSLDVAHGGRDKKFTERFELSDTNSSKGRPRAAHWLHIEAAALTEGMSESLAALDPVGSPSKLGSKSVGTNDGGGIPDIGVVGANSNPPLRPRTAPDVMLQVITTAPLAAPTLPPMPTSGTDLSTRSGVLDSARRHSNASARGMNGSVTERLNSCGPESGRISPKDGSPTNSKGEFLNRYDVWLKKMEQDKWDDADDDGSEYSDDDEPSVTSQLENYVRHIWSDSIPKEVTAVLSKLADCRILSVTQLVSAVKHKPDGDAAGSASDAGGDVGGNSRRRGRSKKAQAKCCYFKGHPTRLNELVILKSNGRCFKTQTLEQLVKQAPPFMLKEEQMELQLLQTKVMEKDAGTIAAKKGGRGGGNRVAAIRALMAVQAQGSSHKRLPNLRAALVRPRQLTLTACPSRQEFYSTYASRSWGTSLVKDEIDPLGLRDRSLRDTSGVKSGTRCMTVNNPWKMGGEEEEEQQQDDDQELDGFDQEYSGSERSDVSQLGEEARLSTTLLVGESFASGGVRFMSDIAAERARMREQETTEMRQVLRDTNADTYEITGTASWKSVEGAKYSDGLFPSYSDGLGNSFKVRIHRLQRILHDRNGYIL
jgi:hypothetical protein